MMTTRCCSQLLGILLLSITLLSIGLGPDACDPDKCRPYAFHEILQNFRNGHCFCSMECSEKDREERTGKADTCVLKCFGGGCKGQNCEDQVKECKMHLGCNGKDCQQTCKATKKCEMNCSRGGCKIQKCEGKVEECKMHLGCSRQHCEQTCQAKTCNMECSGGGCKKQTCDTGNVCNMRCTADNCAQTCKADACHMTRTWPISSQDQLVCSGNGECCGSLMSSYDTLPLSTILYQSCQNENSCTCTRYANSIYSTSNLYTSNVVASTGILLCATKISAGQGTEAWTLRQSSTQSPLSIISPLPFPSPSSQSSLAAEASSSTASKYFLLSKLATAISEAASSATALSLSSSSLSLSAPSASASSPVAAAAETSAVSSSLIPSPSSSLLLVMMTTAASSSTSPSIRTSSSTLAAIKNLVNKYFSELDGIEISGISSMMEAIRVFENFITSIQTISKRKEEIEMTRKSIFNAAVALEEFALNFGKYHLTDTNSSVKIDSQKLVLAIQKASRQNAGDFYLGKKGLPASMKLSSANFANNVSVVAGILHKDLHEVLFIDQPFTITTGNTRYLDSGIMAVAMDPRPEKLQENVILKFRNLNVHEGKRKCMFWSSLNER